MKGVDIPPPTSLWVVVAVTADGRRHLSAHASRNAATKAARRCRARGEAARVWHQTSGAWLSLAEASHARAEGDPARVE